MATTVTVLGAADGTVTVPVTSAVNAAVAQTALAGISMAVAAGALTQVNVSGTDSLPSATTAAIGLVDQSGTPAPAPLVIGNNYVSAVLDGTTPQTVVTGVNPGEVIVSGAAGAAVANLGFNTQVYFGGGDNAFTAVGSPVLDLAPTAQVYLDGNGYFDVSFGATTIFAGAGATMDVVDTGSAGNTINLEAADPDAGSPANTLALGGTATTAATVNAAGAGLVVVQNGGAGLINAHDSDVTIYGVPAAGDGWWSGGGSVTLFGGGGTDFVSGGNGLFAAGSGGGSLLVSSTQPGAATLVGGGDSDTLQAMGSGDVLVAGAGNESLLGGQAPVIAFGFSGVEPAGAVTDMIGGASGGNSFFIGNGSTSITGNHGDAGGNVYAELTSGPKTVAITNFANPDIISLAMPGGGSYQLDPTPNPGAAPAAGVVSFSYLSIGGSVATEVQFGDGATWTLFNSALNAGDFH